MHMPGAPPMWGRFNYRLILAEQRLVWLNSFANADGGIARAPFSDLCPLEIQNSVTFSPSGAGTLVTLHATPFGASAAENAFFAELNSSGSLEQGYGGSFDHLAALLGREAPQPKG